MGRNLSRNNCNDCNLLYLNTVMYHVITGFLSLGSNFIQGMIGGIVALIVIRQLKKHHIG